MRLKYNRKTVLTMLVMMGAMLVLSPGYATLVNYSQDFEKLNQADSTALMIDGWRTFTNVYDTDKTTVLYDEGVFVATNTGAGFYTITGTEFNQQLKVFSDYSNTDHSVGRWIEALVFQEQPISAADVGSIWSFTFDVKQGDQVPDSSSTAFLKTSTSGSILDTTAYGMDWGTETLSLLIDSSMVDQMLQFGFSSTATGYTASGVLYDNISFSSTVIPVPGAVWLMMSGLIGLVGVARRHKR